MDIFTSEKRSEVMSKIQAENTKPELIIRRLLWAKGFRYRVNYKIYGTKPDIVFTAKKLAIFIDGCFWHKCPEHCVMPKSNIAFWKEKLERNAQRDIETTDRFTGLGWKVLRFWEHQVKKEPDACVDQIASFLRSGEGMGSHDH